MPWSNHPANDFIAPVPRAEGITERFARAVADLATLTDSQLLERRDSLKPALIELMSVLIRLNRAMVPPITSDPGFDGRAQAGDEIQYNGQDLKDYWA